MRALLAHEGSEHGIKHGRIQVFTAVRDATEGTPVCRHCHHSFPTWTALRNHIEHAYCPQFDLLQVMPLSLKETRSRLVPQILTHDPDVLHLEPSHGDYLRSHCIVYGMQLLRFQDMTHHLALEHTALATVSTGLYQRWNGSMRSPCSFCHTTFASSHHCKVLQLMILRAETQADLGSCDGQRQVEPQSQEPHRNSPPMRLNDTLLPHFPSWDLLHDHMKQPNRLIYPISLL